MTPRDPVEVFTDLAGRHERLFWLDGGGSRAWSGRRSILGALREEDVSLTYDASAAAVTRHANGRSDVVGDDIFEVLRREAARDQGDASVSWVGYLGYACRRDLPAAPDPTGAPDAVWMRVRDPLVIEHAVREPADGREDPSRADPLADVPADYAGAFAEVQRELRAGNSYEVNLTYRETIGSDVDPVTAYLRLRRLNPAPYAGFLRHGGVCLLSSSPERYATVRRDRVVETKPIKGTTRRGATAEEDAALAERLASDPKFRAENLMIVDLLRNDLSMVCEPGTVEVPSLMAVESYASVHQLVSTVRGRLRDGVGTVDALRALFPAGSMTGAPKLRTMQIIDRVESSPRGVYAGAFGWIGGDGRADLGVVIRSLVAVPGGPPGSRADGAPYTYTLGTGGGITVRSDLEEEWAETRWKADRLRAALDRDG
ncbi:MAG TPA: anthranilate synthase component I family protein [Nocardioides sp.]|nr:anthranilate synthase component I family protein [Nocardioides sp.]